MEYYYAAKEGKGKERRERMEREGNGKKEGERHRKEVKGREG